MKRMLISGLLILMMIFTLSCEKKKKITAIKIAYSNNAFDIAVSHVIKTIIASQTKLNVDLLEMPEEDIAKSLADGSADLSFSFWLPNTSADQLNAYKDSLEFISEYYNDIKTGLAVAEYMPIGSIEQLNSMDSQYPREIVVFDTSSVLTKSVSDCIDRYQLANFKIRAFSFEPEMLTYINHKMEKVEPVIFATYQPHWIFSSMKIKMLTDNQKVFGSPEKAVIYARKDFSKDLKQISAFLKQINLTTADINELMKENEIQDADPKKIAVTWMEQNVDKINLWINKAIDSKK
jgi:glycine betaine/proline transport system substrate-binding protein